MTFAGLGLANSGCATTRAPSPRLALATPLDGVPVRHAEIFGSDTSSELLPSARRATLLALRDELGKALRARGLEVVEVDWSASDETGRAPSPATLAALGREVGADHVLFVRLLAYGEVRRSWLWLLAAQGFAAGIGHGVAVTAATGDPTLGWWAGIGEFALETVTWVGGALVASRSLDPVALRVWLVASNDGTTVKRWTREGTRPFRQWFVRRGRPPRAERLRAVAASVFSKLAPKVARRLGVRAPPVDSLPRGAAVFSGEPEWFTPSRVAPRRTVPALSP